MAPDRITSAIDSLITNLVPNDPNQGEDAAQEQHDRCFEMVKETLERLDGFDILLLSRF